MKSRSLRTAGLAALLLAALLAAAPAAADPPPWAPAHGWRAQQDAEYQGYGGARWSHDYGVIAGRCDTAAVGAALGAVAGGAAGAQIGQDQGRQIAILFGSVVGAMLGADLGRDIDETDRACIGQALELAPSHRTVRWANPRDGGLYVLTPTRDIRRQQRPCREFEGMLIRNGRSEPLRGTACRAAGGAWHLT